jgi:predicted transcriptional regulator of viral defense system
MRPVENKSEVLIGLARRGPVRARDLAAAGVPRAYLRRLCDRGLLEQVDRGLYRLADAPVTELHSLAEVATRMPDAIVCLMSALQVHELTTEVPNAVWVLIDRHARTPKVAYPKLEVVRASGPAREHGIENRTIEGVRMRITTPAKTVADCFRYRRRVGLDVALAALRDYLAKSRGRATKRERRAGHGAGSGYGDSRGDGYGDPFVYSIDALVDAARADRIYGFMRPYLEALA